MCVTFTLLCMYLVHNINVNIRFRVFLDLEQDLNPADLMDSSKCLQPWESSLGWDDAKDSVSVCYINKNTTPEISISGFLLSLLKKVMTFPESVSSSVKRACYLQLTVEKQTTAHESTPYSVKHQSHSAKQREHTKPASSLQTISEATRGFRNMHGEGTRLCSLTLIPVLMSLVKDRRIHLPGPSGPEITPRGKIAHQAQSASCSHQRKPGTDEL